MYVFGSQGNNKEIEIKCEVGEGCHWPVQASQQRMSGQSRPPMSRSSPGQARPAHEPASSGQPTAHEPQSSE